MTQMTVGGEDAKESRSTGMIQMTQMTKMRLGLTGEAKICSGRN